MSAFDPKIRDRFQSWFKPVPWAMEEKLMTAGKTAEFHIYPGASHGFRADYRPSYRKEAAEDAWNRMIDWFKKYRVLA